MEGGGLRIECTVVLCALSVTDCYMYMYIYVKPLSVYLSSHAHTHMHTHTHTHTHAHTHTHTHTRTHAHTHTHTENLQINWPEGAEEEDFPEDVRDIVEQLLCYDPYYRLGSAARGGVDGVRAHPFFTELDWTTMLKQKAEFIPQLQGEEDTSYFDSE